MKTRIFDFFKYINYLEKSTKMATTLYPEVVESTSKEHECEFPLVHGCQVQGGGQLLQ